MLRKPHRYQQIDERLNRMSAVLDGLIARSAERVRQGASGPGGAGRSPIGWRYSRTVAAIRVAVELLRSDITWVVAELPRFFDFFPEYRGYELVAGVAGMTVDETVARHAERQGLMVFGPGDEVARMLNRPDFRPKVRSSSETGLQER